MRKTKIICTIGPASESEEVLAKLCKAGMNVARLNFSHGSHEEHLKKMNTIKKVREALGLPIAIMLDTKGPEFRIKTFAEGKITLKDGDPFTFTARDVKGSQTEVSISYPGLVNDLEPVTPSSSTTVCSPSRWTRSRGRTSTAPPKSAACSLTARA